MARGRDYAGQHRQNQAAGRSKAGNNGKRPRQNSARTGGTALGVWAWMVMGISVLLLGAVLYAISRPAGPMQMSPSSEVNHSTKNNPALATKVVIPPKEKPKYDFYTMLPSEQVEAMGPANPAAEARPPPQPVAVVVPPVAATPAQTPPPLPAAAAEVAAIPVAAKPSVWPEAAPAVTASAAKPATAKPAVTAGSAKIAVPKPAEKPRPEPAKPAAAPAAVARLPAATGGRFLIQVAAYRGRADAEQDRARLALNGVNAHVEEGLVNGVTWYRVRLGPYASREAAVPVLAKLQAGGHKGVLVPAGRQ